MEYLLFDGRLFGIFGFLKTFSFLGGRVADRLLRDVQQLDTSFFFVRISGGKNRKFLFLCFKEIINLTPLKNKQCRQGLYPEQMIFTCLASAPEGF